jgi:glycosyltransferase involved in cell wall biosynthesis
MKKIIFTVINDLTYDQRMHRIVSSLSKNGYRCELVGRELKSSKPVENDFVFETRRFKCFFNKGKLFYLEYNFKLFLFLLRSSFDIVCSVDLDTILPGVVASKLKNKTLVYDAHEYFQEVPEVVNRPLTKKIWVKVAKISIPKADLCYTVSESLCAEFEKLYGKKFYLIRNLPLLSNNLSAEDVKDKIIIYQGAVNEGRGLEMLVEAMQQIEAKLLIVGDGDIFGKIKTLIHKYKVEDKIEMTGYLCPKDFNELTKKALIGYNVLENKGKSYYYSLSNKLFAYIQNEIPSISSNFPEYKKIIEKYKIGLICEPKKNNIIEKINLLLTNNIYYKELVENCRIARRELNWQEEEKELIRLYNGL